MNDYDIITRLEYIHENLDRIANSLEDIKIILSIKFEIDQKKLDEEKMRRL